MAVAFFLLLPVLLYFLAKGPPRGSGGEMESFTIIYTGGIQGKLMEPSERERVNGTAPADFGTLYFTLSRLRAEAENRREPVIFVDTGNSLSGDEDVSRQMGGRPIYRLMKEIPYSAILLGQNETTLGREALESLGPGIALLGELKGCAAVRPQLTERAGPLKVGFQGGIQGNPGQGLGDESPHVRILLLPGGDGKDLAGRVKGFDLVIPSAIERGTKGDGVTEIDGVPVAPAVDSRFFVGKLRMARKKGEKKWAVSFALERVAPGEETAPGGILNVLLDARQETEIAYRGRYLPLYEGFAAWVPSPVEGRTLAGLAGRAFAGYCRADAALIDSTSIRVSAGNCWGSREILDVPGGPVSLETAWIDGEKLEGIVRRNPRLVLWAKPTGPGKILVAGDGRILRENPGVFEMTGRVPVMGNFILLDYFRRHRGEIFLALGGDPALGGICRELDDWRFDRAAKLAGDGKTGRDALMLGGMALFKARDMDGAMRLWEEAGRLDRANPGIKGILAASPEKAVATAPAKSQKNHPWPRFRGGPRGTGRSELKGPGAPLLQWKFYTGGKVIGSPVVARDGTVYVGSESRSLFALDPAGRLKWKFDTGLPIRSTPAIGEDGTVYAGSDDGFLYALSPAGRVKWKFKGGGFFSSSPCIGPNGTIYAACEDGFLYAISPGGKLAWKFQAGELIFSSPALAPDGTIFFGCEDHFLYALRPDGSLRWKLDAGHKVTSSPAVGDGAVYVGSEDRSIYAVSFEGKILWKAATGNYVTSSPAVGPDGTVYAGSEDRHLYAVSAAGKILWKMKTGGEVISSPLVDSEGFIYAGSDDGCLHSVWPDGRSRWKFMSRDPMMSSPAIGGDGTIYVGSEDGNIYAVGK
jgi:outer membrane protein assembly factor BamB